MTPVAVRFEVKGFQDRAEANRDLVLFAAYGNAALSLTDPKKFPKTFDEWLGRPKKPTPQMDGGVIYSNLKAWASANAERN